MGEVFPVRPALSEVHENDLPEFEDSHPNTTDFLGQVYGSGFNPEEIPLSAQSARALAENLIGSYRVDYLSRTFVKKRRDMAELRAQMARSYVKGMPLEEISEAHPEFSAKLVQVHIGTIPGWLREADAAKRIDLNQEFERAKRNSIVAHPRRAPATEQPPTPRFSKVKRHLSLVAGLAEPAPLQPVDPEPELYERDPLRQQLFGEAEPDDTAAMTWLARGWKLQANNKNKKLRKAEVFAGVVDILRRHDELARGSENQGAVFGLLDPQKDLERITALTANVVWTWELACMRHNRHNPTASPFAELPAEIADSIDFTRADVRLVVEAASAAAETLQAGYTANTAGQQTLLANFIARHGPGFAAGWMRGDVIRNLCGQHGLDAERWLKHMPRSRRVYFAKYHPDDPIGAVEKLIKGVGKLDVDRIKAETGLSEDMVIQAAIQNLKNIEAGVQELVQRRNMLTPQRISEKIGWGLEEVEEFFTPGYLNRIARASTDPLSKIEEAAVNFDSVLSLSNLEKELGLSRSRLESLFPPSYRRRLVIEYPGDPLNAARNVAKLSSSIAKDYPELPERLVGVLAMSYPRKARLVARHIASELAETPAGISKNMWAWAVFQRPNADANTRLRHIDSYLEWIASRSEQSADAGTPYDERSMYDRVDGSMGVSPVAATSTPGRPSDYLKELAAKAGVPLDQVEQLLDEFASADDQRIADNALAQALAKLKAAADS